MKLFDIKYSENNKNDIISCSESSLKHFKEWASINGRKIISISERLQSKKANVALNKDIIEKNNFYYSKYSTEKSRLNRNKITKEEFDERIKLLKTLRIECKTKNQFRKRYEKIYK